MRFDANKSYPHPVLRPGSSDYPRSEFETVVEVNRVLGTTLVTVVTQFALSDPDLLSLVNDGSAEFVLRVRSLGTRHRSSYSSDVPEIIQTFANGQLHGQTEFWGFVVATRDLDDFRINGWHRDYEGMHLRIVAGSVLCEDEPYWQTIDTAEEAPIGSCFQIQERAEVPNGTWRCNLDGERVTLEMSSADCRKFIEASDRLNDSLEVAYIWNSIYLPAVVFVLQEGDRVDGEHQDRRWFRSLDTRLEVCGCKPLGSERSDRLADAQKILEQPFGKLPLMTGED